ncbi:MAG: hypothetical protein KAG97_00510 [Victivallales bacterium]|nr:hypothetical protein [Victivallales bacterium]
MSYLGLDIGTSGCKAVVFNVDGAALGAAYKEYAVLTPEPGYAELDSGEVMEACFDVMREAAGTTDGDPISGMCISSQGEAFTPVGRDGEIIGNGMVSSDARAANLVDEVVSKFGGERLYEITGHTAYSMFTLFKLLWLKRNRPELWERAEALHCYEDLMHLRLGLAPAISWPLAGRTMMFDVNSHSWSCEILDFLGLSDSHLARPLPTGALVGEIPADLAAEAGLPKGVKVYAGGHDQTVGAVGAGVVEDGVAMYATGTVECICPVLSEKCASRELREANLCCYDYAIQGKYTTVAYSLTGANILQWFKNEFGQPEAAKASETGRNVYELLLEAVPEANTDIIALPHFTPTGTPHFDAAATGAILGLRLSTSRGEILKALLEGVALEMRLNLDIMERSGMCVDKFIATGGGAKSAKWIQLKANALNRPISVLEIEEAGCFGAAMIAMSAETNIPLSELTAKGRNDLATLAPDPNLVATYDAKFAKYKKLYPTLKKLR